MEGTCLSPTNSCLSCTLGGPDIEITAIATSALKYDAPKQAAKFGALEHGILEYDDLEYGATDFGALDNGTLGYSPLTNVMKATGNVKALKIGTELFFDTINFGDFELGALYLSDFEYSLQLEGHRRRLAIYHRGFARKMNLDSPVKKRIDNVRSMTALCLGPRSPAARSSAPPRIR